MPGAIDYLIATHSLLSSLVTEGFEPSRLWLYYNTRAIECDPLDNAGTYQSDAIQLPRPRASPRRVPHQRQHRLHVSLRPLQRILVRVRRNRYAIQHQPGLRKLHHRSPLYDPEYIGSPTNYTLDGMKAVLAQNKVFTFLVNCDFFPCDNSFVGKPIATRRRRTPPTSSRSMRGSIPQMPARPNRGLLVAGHLALHALRRL